MQTTGRTEPSSRKHHNTEAGYVAERTNPWQPRTKVVIYEAELQGIDAWGKRYALVCDAHAQVGGAMGMRVARELMKHPEDFCTDCRVIAEGQTCDKA